MIIKSVHFVKSSENISKCPQPTKGEFAFIGRSNVGKSSLINMLMNKKKLAKISSTPGKTQLINHFLVNDQWYLVDLPGYGWAKASKTNKLIWQKMTRAYLLGRGNLATTLVLVDIRLDPQEIDTSFISWMGEKQLPFIIIFTKSDKLSKNKIQGAVKKYKYTLQKSWEETPAMIISSSKNSIGKDEILTHLEDILKEIPYGFN